ncbi:hypothetical protein S7335_5011 [Synechococcus sp. PCC 7335]|uniref:hypothetical protein n=1 Tax=Synechococcus sp. (strain ATCC 29403 / PCC 7335) TaxID=91464 RepID=UPI00017EB869|nr:hypothetical protein [Synechococcus sp. PCC 7335]EDX87303.1 hypothetical protein S7335_5011 [Synechococcus sp. PCC 7335]
MADLSNQPSNNPLGAESADNILSAPTSTLTGRQMFVLSAITGGLLSFASIALSMQMTQTAITDLSPVTVGIALAMPFVFGALGFKFKQPFLDALSAMMNSLPY